MQNLRERMYWPIAVIVCCLAALLIFLPLMRPGWYPMHDSTHPVRILLLQATVREGQFPPIWTEQLNQDLGYPLFHFYAPLFHSSVALLASIVPLYLALKAALVIMVALGGLGVMHMLKSYGLWPSLVGAVLYMLSPFAAVDLYVRGAFAEYLALALLPWVVSVTRQLTTRRRVFLAASLLALLVLAHNLIPLLVLPWLGLWMGMHNYRAFPKVLLTGLLALGLSAWFVGPLLVERSFTQADVIAKTTTYAAHFVEPWQMWNSTWGFGGSAPGVEDGMSFKLGKIQLLLALAGWLLALKRRDLAWISLGLTALIYAWVATPASRILWDNLPVLQLVQFPWRSLGVITVILALLGGYALSALASVRPSLKVGVAGLLIALTVILNLKYFRPQTLLPESFAITDIAPVVPEYLPRWLAAPAAAPVPGERAYYPTWIVTQDGKRLQTYPSQAGYLRYTTVSAAPVTIKQGHTTFEGWCYLLTVMSFLGGLVYVRRAA